ncbi:unannotated protein [freshwater metagenome]|uniref:Unannotated protein n=1 Tax=freshwater metagenome TaxID=449393 RepID=A0A6J6ETW5_9ZZZZ
MKGCPSTRTGPVGDSSPPTSTAQVARTGIVAIQPGNPVTLPNVTVHTAMSANPAHDIVTRRDSGMRRTPRLTTANNEPRPNSQARVCRPKKDQAGWESVSRTLSDSDSTTTTPIAAATRARTLRAPRVTTAMSAGHTR